VNDEEFRYLFDMLTSEAANFRDRYKVGVDHHILVKLPDEDFDELVERNAVDILYSDWNVQAVPARWYILEES
jgi:hypothetical protein